MASYVAYLVIWGVVLAGRIPAAVLALTLALAGGQAAWHFTLIRHREREKCFRAFRVNHWLAFTVFAGVVAGYALR